MQVFKTACFVLVAMALTVATEVRPSAAMVIYPWCADYGGGGKGDTAPAVVDSYPFISVWRRLAGMGGPVVQIHGISPIRRLRRTLRL
jgi:hypothetical protein